MNKLFITVFVFLILGAIIMLGWGYIAVAVMAGFGLLGAIFTFINWLNPIRRFIRKHHGIEPTTRMLKDSSIVYVAYTPTSKEIAWMKLGTLVRMQKAALPHRWVIFEDVSDEIGTRYFHVRCDHWDFAQVELGANRVAFSDRCGNRLWIEGKNPVVISAAIMQIDAKYENVHDMHLQEFCEFAEKKLKEALRATQNIAVHQIDSVIPQATRVDHRYQDTQIPEYERQAEERYPSTLPKQEATAQ